MPPRRRQDVDLITEADVVTFDRETFLRDYWDYRPGEHVTILAPSGGGKTHLAFQLMNESTSPRLQATVIVMKPRDETVSKFTRRLKFKTIRDWPPAKIKSVFQEKTRGYVLWPREAYDPEDTEAQHYAIFRRCILDNYKNAKSRTSDGKILFTDEAVSLVEELNLAKPMKTVWSKGRSNFCGLWAASQRPVDIPRIAYQSHHLFLGLETDWDVLRRYGEIGAAIDKDLVRALVSNLEMKQYVYIHRDTRSVCIVDI